MNARDWLDRWEEGRTGWHEPDGNAGLRQYWSEPATGSKVLVPLCGKSVDLLWLADQGLAVSGVELSKTAVESFFAEQRLEYDIDRSAALEGYRAEERLITLYCGDFFDFHSDPFDALYDRGALVALPESLRPRYVSHVKELLKPDAQLLLVTLEYDSLLADGPPFSVLPEEVRGYWPDLERISARNAIDGCPPKFREAGIDEVIESIWSRKAVAP